MDCPRQGMGAYAPGQQVQRRSPGRTRDVHQKDCQGQGAVCNDEIEPVDGTHQTVEGRKSYVEREYDVQGCTQKE